VRSAAVAQAPLLPPLLPALLLPPPLPPLLPGITAADPALICVGAGKIKSAWSTGGGFISFP
jgi:hypothetical protein